MDTNLVMVLYFLVVVIVVLTLVIVREKHFLENLLGKKDIQQEEIMDLKLEKIRLKHIIKMQDETISHMLTANAQYSKSIEFEYPKRNTLEEPAVQEWHLDEYESMNRDYYQL
ncbi:hypothetical protein UAW_02440 [Enterococcus haemoperoxidus ATCC BAA-382]|uniref:Uncharacterized protein n=1 Tax=Enterococcus haemoperoxidus ATCC BAA-382 TaxID=1158608 RepID=R2T1A4_9ENTE|nr:hypothetical protein [Enterococcus haemoperoxidus]EOH94019.1 hypothetical protein UAW_02440 [Enterococcus haemoperoxidus ATCC BAA-382]EOT63327.1 hypothetical protein I583_00127 [Enterococcus haemoperoxidus ATCC BAA-382]OJG54005.1 hypothetical protein RV06_GL000398 [Enterococcus haemoperoxidus]